MNAKVRKYARMGRTLRVFLIALLVLALMPVWFLAPPQRQAYAASGLENAPTGWIYAADATLNGWFPGLPLTGPLFPAEANTSSTLGYWYADSAPAGSYLVNGSRIGGNDHAGWLYHLSLTHPTLGVIETDIRVWCHEPGALGPDEVGYSTYNSKPVFIVLRSIDAAAGTISIVLGVGLGGDGAQYLIAEGETTINWPIGGHLGITKVSANPAMTNGNSLYPLDGAQFGLYGSSADATSDTNRLETLITDSQGKATTAEMYNYGTYYIRELQAPRGYELDETVQTVTIGAGTSDANNVTWKTFSDKPGNDPVGALIYKVDSETGEQVPQMGASLAHAQFTVEYYSGLYTIDGTNTGGATPLVDENPSGYPELPGGTEPTRTWVFETNEQGYVYLINGLFVGGDPLYTDSNGIVTLPYGTYVIHESAAPTGYLLPANQERYLTRIIYDETNVSGRVETINGTTTFLPPYVNKEGAFFAEVGNEADLQNNQSEQVIRGDLQIAKIYEDEVGDEHNAGSGSGVATPEAGVIFNIYPMSDVVDEEGSPWDTSADATNVGKPALSNSATALFSMTTNDQGIATSENVHVTDNRAVDGTYTVRERTADDRGGLPFGTYLAVQTNSVNNSGIAKPFFVTVDTNDKLHNYVVRNTDEPSAVRVVKVDAVSGLQVPYPATWSIKDTASGELVAMVGDRTSQRPITEFVSNANGELILPEKLPLGNYELIEVTAPAANGLGYLRNPVNVPFAVTEANDWTTPIVVTMADERPAGTITLRKTDSVTSAPVSGAVYELRAAADIVTLDGERHYSAGDYICDMETGANGTAVVEGLYLGQYKLVEIESPAGYGLDRTTHYVTLEYADQETAVVYATADVVDIPTTLKVVKTDTYSGELLEGATFTLTQQGAAYYDVETLLSVLDETFTGQDFDPQNTYSYDAAALNDTITALGGQSGRLIVPLTVEPGASGFAQEQAYITFNSDKTINVEYRLIDNITIPEVYEENVVYTQTSDAEGNLSFPYLTQGEWVLEEIEPADGYRLPEQASWMFIVDAEGVIQGIDNPLTVTNEPDVELKTEALDKESGTNIIAPAESVTIVDTVSYSGLTSGVEYTVSGVLMDKETGEELLVDGEPITAETTFTAPQSSGTVEVVFTFDGFRAMKKTIVVFETLYEDDVVLGVHADINDQDQTVIVEEPEIGTLATINGEKSVNVDAKTAVIKDTVSYSGLTPGVEYTLVGYIMDKSTGKPYTLGNRAGGLSATLTFTPEQSSGTVEVVFPEFDILGLGGTELVVFEELYMPDADEPVAEHKDITDIGQTVSIKKPGSPYANTGNIIDWLLPVVIGLGLLICGATAIAVIKLRSARRKARTATQTLSEGESEASAGEVSEDTE